MTIYALVQKVEPGCPVNLLQDVLYDEFISNIEKINFGHRPWYTTEIFEGNIFSENMYLLSKHKVLNFDIQDIGDWKKNIECISENFFQLLKKFSIPIKEIKPLQVVNFKNQSIVKKKYFVIRWADSIALDHESIIDSKSVLKWDEYKSSFQFEKLILKNTPLPPLFKIRKTFPSNDALFCSQEFYDASKEKKIIGIDFQPIDKIVWADFEEDSYFRLLLAGKPVPFFHK